MDFDLKELEAGFLKELRKEQFLELIKLQRVESAANKAEIKKLKDFVANLEKEVKRRDDENEKKAKENLGKTEGSAKDYTSHKIKNMSHTIATEVPIFSSGMDVHTWLNKLDSYYKLYVANDTSGIMEEHFVQNAKSRLCSEYLHSMVATSDATDTFATMSVYMKKNHASKMSVFQILDTLWEMNQTDAESFRDYGIRLDDKAVEAENIIVAKFKEWTETKGDVSDMTLSDVFKLISGQVFLQNLKNKEQIIYNNICNDLDKTWSAREIAIKAMTFSDRMSTSNESRNQGSVPDAFAAQRGNNSNSKQNSNNKPRQNSKQKDKICSFFVMGTCSRGDQCNRKHSEEHRKAYWEVVRRESKEGEKNQTQPKPQVGNKGSNAKNSNRSYSQAATCVATSDEIPVVPLPTQNFRH